MKKLISIAAALSLCASLVFAPLAFAARGSFVLDEYGVLERSQFNTLESKAQELAEDYNIGVYLLFTDNVGAGSARDYAKNYYLNNNLGVGKLKAGILFLVAVESRDYVTITYGDAGGKTIPYAGGVDAFTDARVQNMEYDIIRYLRNNDWYGAADVYYDDAEDSLEYLAEHGEPMNNYRLDYSGYEAEDSSETDLLFNIGLAVLTGLGVPAVAAGGMVSREKRAMKTAHEATEASNYLMPNSLELSVKEDNYINTTHTVVPLPRDDDDDRGSGGGGMFGGGFGGFGGSSIDSGGFGGSGGGKF